MIECFVKENKLSDAYHAALMDLYKLGIQETCSQWNTTQRDVSMTIVVNKPLEEPLISKLFIGGPQDLQQYCMEMLDGILDFEVEKGNWNYTYHDRMVNYRGINQLEFVINELRQHPDSRRAVIDFRDTMEDSSSNDPACLQHIQFCIREGKLECKVLFRSNDACKATFMNMFALIMLQSRVATELGVPVGSYTHRANSFHVYERDYSLLKGYYSRILSGENLTFDYSTEWKSYMEESIDLIMNKVRGLKNET